MSTLKFKVNKIFVLLILLIASAKSIFCEQKNSLVFENIFYSSGSFKNSTWEKSKEIFLFTDDQSKRVKPCDAFDFKNSINSRLNFFRPVKGGKNSLDLQTFVYSKDFLFTENNFAFALGFEHIWSKYKISTCFGNIKFAGRASSCKGSTVYSGSTVTKNYSAEKCVTVTAPTKSTYSKDLSFCLGLKPVGARLRKLPVVDFYGTLKSGREVVAGANFVCNFSNQLFPVMWLGASGKFEEKLNLEFFAETVTSFWMSTNSLVVKNVDENFSPEIAFKSLNNFELGKWNFKLNFSVVDENLNWFVSAQNYCWLENKKSRLLYGAGFWSNGKQDKIRFDGKFIWGKNNFSFYGVQTIDGLELMEELKKDFLFCQKFVLNGAGGKFCNYLGAQEKFGENNWQIKGSYKVGGGGECKWSVGASSEVEFKRQDKISDWALANWNVKSTATLAWKYVKLNLEFLVED